MDEPDLSEVRSTLRAYRELAGPDRSQVELLAATSPRLDPAIAAHRRALHRWLNAWGCRIRYARPPEPDRFDAAIAAWWARRGRPLEVVQEPLAELTDEHIRVLADAFDDLSTSAIAVDGRGHERTMGPTAAAKCLYALRPRSVMPWDLMIAQRLHGGRDRDAFARHLSSAASGRTGSCRHRASTRTT